MLRLLELTAFKIWGQINPAPGVINFDGFRSLQALFDAAKAAGVWVVLRPAVYYHIMRMEKFSNAK